MAEETKMQEVELHRDAALERVSEFENPGLPAHRKRQTDLHPEKAKRAERTVFTWFLVSALGSTQSPSGSAEIGISLIWSPASSAKAKPTQPSEVSLDSMFWMMTLSSAEAA